jgi:hypothetical protein
MSSFKKELMFRTQHDRGRRRTYRGAKYRVRIETIPDITMLCTVRDGIHTARWGGTTQKPSAVRIVITPNGGENQLVGVVEVLQYLLLIVELIGQSRQAGSGMASGIEQYIVTHFRHGLSQ